MQNLNELVPIDSGWILEVALAINDQGQIVGRGYLGGGERAFLLTPISLLISNIIDFINDNTDIVGIGAGNSANNKYNIFLNMLNTAADLIDNGDNAGVCGLLNSIAQKCDESEIPPDFITGNPSTMEELMEMLVLLLESLGCE